MTEITSVASFRRVTPGIVASARLAMANDVPDISKSEIALLLKRAAPVLGIDGTAYHVMDILLGLSRADDWKGARRPIVAISNAKLAEYTMRSERTVMRCIRRLVEVGIAAYRDSATGRRFVYRDDQGEMSVGYGIDFTPARVRAAELKTAVDQYQLKLNRELAAKRDISRLARAIEDMGKAYPESGLAWRARLAYLRASGLDLEAHGEALRALHTEVVIEATGDQKLHDLSSEGDIGVTPNNNTTHKSIYISKTQPTENPDQGAKSKNKHVVKIAYDKKYVFADRAKKLGLDVYNQRGADIVQGEILASISIGLLQVACRKAQIMIDMHFDNWAALGRAGETLRRMIGLSEAVWGDGRLRVGLYGASAIIATILEKAIRDPQQISNPAGYFRAMIDRAVEGKLNLERSLFGLAESSDDNAKIHGGT